MQRVDAIERLKTEAFDILVIGGGATGTGIALDAATRGFKVALVERYDYASGASSRSTKMIHGGVRYLEQAVKKFDLGQYRLVREALAERATFLKLAPHLSRRVALVTPSYSSWEQLYYWFGLKLYDLLAGRWNIGSAKLLSRDAALAAFPGIRATGLIGAVLYYDGQFDDARMNVALALTAEREGAVLANYIEVVALSKTSGRVVGAQVRDRSEEAAAFEIAARAVVNATGPFADAIRALDDAAVRPMLRTSSGIHIVIDGDFCPPETGMLVPKTDDGRVLFVLPWSGKTLIGTTDEAAEPADHPAAGEAEITYLLRHVNRYFKEPVRADQVLAAWSGFRPLVARETGAGGTAKLVRDHVVCESASGLVTISGGKWTTYRVMASDAVDHLISQRHLVAKSPCITDRVPLVGAEAYRSDGAQALLQRFALAVDVASHLNRAYGDQAERVATLCADGLGQRLLDQYPYIEAEIVWAARAEHAQSVMDVLARRMRLAFLDRAAAERSVDRVAQLLGVELRWSDDRREREKIEARERLRSGL